MEPVEKWIERFHHVLGRWTHLFEDLKWKISIEEQCGDKARLERLRAELKELEKKYKLLKKKYKLLNKQGEKNVRILHSTWRAKNKMDIRRARFALYRLYRHLEIHPYDIAYIITGERKTKTAHQIMRRIGTAFKELCLKDDKCIFKPHLQHQAVNQHGLDN